MVRWIGDENRREVHDLYYEEPNCSLHETPEEQKRPFVTIKMARAAGYKECEWCVGRSNA